MLPLVSRFPATAIRVSLQRVQPHPQRFRRAFTACFVLLGLLGFGLVSFAAPPASPSAKDRLERLEQKVDALNASLERVLFLLEGNASAPTAVNTPAQPSRHPEVPAPAAPAESDQPMPVELTGPTSPGTTLDLWLRPPGYKGGIPTTPSLVTLRDDRGPFFHLARHEKEPSMAGNTGKALVHVWRGHLQIKTSGTHVLIADFQRKKDRIVATEQKWDDYLFAWAARLRVGGKTLLDETNRFTSAGKGTLSRTFTLELEPGYYPVEIVSWMPKQADEEEYYFKPLTFALRLREPGTDKPRDLGPTDFVHSE